MTGDSSSDNKDNSPSPTSASAESKAGEEKAAKSDQDKTSKKTPASTPENKPAVTTETPSKPPAKGRSAAGMQWLVLVILVLLIAGLGTGGYFGWQEWQLQNQRLQALETQTANQNSAVEALSTSQSQQTDTQRSQLDEIKQDQQDLQQRLNSHSERLRALAGTSRDDWLLAEARYLLRLAAQRLLVERGTEGALALLTSADAILQSLDEAGVLPIRNAIANEIIALKLAKSVDRQGLYARISAIKVQIKTLPVIAIKTGSIAASGQATTTAQPDPDAPPPPWHAKIWGSIQNAFSGLERFVQVRHHDEVPELLVSEQYQAQLVNNLLLMLEQSQFALLHEEAEIYQMSLQQAVDWWKAYFIQHQEYEVIHNELNQLLQTNIVQELPSISSSLTLLTEYIERFHRLNAPQAAINQTQPATEETAQ